MLLPGCARLPRVQRCTAPAWFTVLPVAPSPHTCPAACPTAESTCNNCSHPALAGPASLQEGEGFSIAMAALDGGRINIGACSVGGAAFCLDAARSYVKSRHQFGRAVGDFQVSLV